MAKDAPPQTEHLPPTLLRRGCYEVVESKLSRELQSLSRRTWGVARHPDRGPIFG